MKTFIEFLTLFLIGILVVLFFGLILAYPFMLLWNWLMPAMFGLVKITFWQSYGFMVMVRLFFGININNNKSFN